MGRDKPMVRIKLESSLGFMIGTCDLNYRVELIHCKVEQHAEISRLNIRVHNLDDDIEVVRGDNLKSFSEKSHVGNKSERDIHYYL